jgi:hypothetical protein
MRSIAVALAVNVLVVTVLLELVLRAQQAFVPLIELNLSRAALMIGHSDEYNHGTQDPTQWDDIHIRKLSEPNSANCSPRILFMGDSFMQGVDPENTVPLAVRKHLREQGVDPCVLNSAFASYSPSIFVVLARKLVPALRPDYVVIGIDETDLYDDYHRYRELITRDMAGSIVAVRATPIGVRFSQGIADAMTWPFYVQRLVAKSYFTRVEFPKLEAEYNARRPSDLFWASRLPEEAARKTFRAEIDHFRTTLEDLTKTVVTLVGSPERLIYIRHPHLEHFANPEAKFNDIVSTTVREVATLHGARFFDVREELRTKFGARPSDFYISKDMHFNDAGFRAFETAVAKYLFAVLTPG